MYIYVYIHLYIYLDILQSLWNIWKAEASVQTNDLTFWLIFLTIGGAVHANQTPARVYSEDSANAAGLKASQRCDWTSYSPSNSYSTHYITNMSFHFSQQNENIVAPP